jgi:hypothetical protein
MIGQFFESLRETTRTHPSGPAAKQFMRAGSSKCTRVTAHAQ